MSFIFGIRYAFTLSQSVLCTMCGCMRATFGSGFTWITRRWKQKTNIQFSLKIMKWIKIANMIFHRVYKQNACLLHCLHAKFQHLVRQWISSHLDSINVNLFCILFHFSSELYLNADWSCRRCCFYSFCASFSFCATRFICVQARLRFIKQRKCWYIFFFIFGWEKIQLKF